MFLLITFSIISILSKLPVIKRDDDKLDPYFFIQEIDSLEISLFLENPIFVFKYFIFKVIYINYSISCSVYMYQYRKIQWKN